MTHPIDALPPLREVIAAHRLSARKSLGQNFLLDLNLTRRIARSAGSLETGTTIEVGPGPGGLTRALLLEGAHHVLAIERDARCIEALQPLQEAAGGRLTLINADALDVDLTIVGPHPLRIVANLPYNIATKLLTGWLQQSDRFESLTVMFQKEVAERIIAAPGQPAYSRLSVLCNWLCMTRTLLTLPPQAFTPPPKVASAVVHLRPYRPIPDGCSLSALEAITQAAFGQRRKMLRASLKTRFSDAEATLSALKIDPTRRAETLTLEEFALLARALQEDR